MVCDSCAAAGKFTSSDGSIYVAEFKDNLPINLMQRNGEERGGRVRESSRAREDER